MYKLEIFRLIQNISLHDVSKAKILRANKTRMNMDF